MPNATAEHTVAEFLRLPGWSSIADPRYRCSPNRSSTYASLLGTLPRDAAAQLQWPENCTAVFSGTSQFREVLENLLVSNYERHAETEVDHFERTSGHRLNVTSTLLRHPLATTTCTVQRISYRGNFTAVILDNHELQSSTESDGLDSFLARFAFDAAFHMKPHPDRWLNYAHLNLTRAGATRVPCRPYKHGLPPAAIKGSHGRRLDRSLAEGLEGTGTTEPALLDSAHQQAAGDGNSSHTQEQQRPEWWIDVGETPTNETIRHIASRMQDVHAMYAGHATVATEFVPWNAHAVTQDHAALVADKVTSRKIGRSDVLSQVHVCNPGFPTEIALHLARRLSAACSRRGRNGSAVVRHTHGGHTAHRH